MVTPLGLAFLPIAAWALCVRPRDNLFGLLIFASVFQAGAVANVPIGGTYIGLMPYYVAAIFLCARMALSLAGGKQGYTVRDPSGFLKLLVIFTSLAVAGSFLWPNMFSGTPVYAPRGGIDSQVDQQTPLTYSFSNLGQAGYLAINLLILVYVSLRTWQWSSLERCVLALHAASAVVVFAGLYQLVAFWAGLPFPDWFFNSNLGGAQLASQSLGGIGRISGTFSEASNLAAYLSSYCAFLVILAMGRQLRPLGFLMLALSGVCLLASTSSTAYLVTAVVAIALFLKGAVLPVVTRAKLRRVRPKESVAVVVLSIVIVSVSVVALRSGYGEVLYEATLGKTSSGSYEHRSASNLYAVDLLRDTWGLGVGLGSNRPSSFLAWLASNVGVVGLILFAAAYAKLLRAASNYARQLPPSLGRKRALLAALQWAFCTHVVAKVVSQPDLAFPTFWMWTVLLFVWMKAAASSGRSREKSCTHANSSRAASVQVQQVTAKTYSAGERGQI